MLDSFPARHGMRWAAGLGGGAPIILPAQNRERHTVPHFDFVGILWIASVAIGQHVSEKSPPLITLRCEV
jgi:hypothetical protein